MCCFHALEHYSQHFSKKRNLVCTPFTMCNCPNWIRTNITRVKFLCANLYTIEQCVSCEFILYDGENSQPTSYNKLRKNALEASSCLRFNDFNTCQISLQVPLIFLYHFSCSTDISHHNMFCLYTIYCISGLT